MISTEDKKKITILEASCSFLNIRWQAESRNTVILVWHAKVNRLEFTSIYILKTYYIEVHDDNVIQTGLQIKICVQYHDIPDNIRLDCQAWCKPVTNFIIYMMKRT